MNFWIWLIENKYITQHWHVFVHLNLLFLSNWFAPSVDWCMARTKKSRYFLQLLLLQMRVQGIYFLWSCKLRQSNWRHTLYCWTIVLKYNLSPFCNCRDVWGFLPWPPEESWKGCRQSEDSLAVGQVNRQWVVSPTISSNTRAVAKNANFLKENYPGVQHVSPVRMMKLCLLKRLVDKHVRV